MMMCEESNPTVTKPRGKRVLGISGTSRQTEAGLAFAEVPLIDSVPLRFILERFLDKSRSCATKYEV